MYHCRVGGPLDPPHPAMTPATKAATRTVSPPLPSALTAPFSFLAGNLPPIPKTQTSDRVLCVIGGPRRSSGGAGDPAAVGGDDAEVGAVAGAGFEDEPAAGGRRLPGSSLRLTATTWSPRWSTMVPGSDGRSLVSPAARRERSAIARRVNVKTDAGSSLCWAAPGAGACAGWSHGAAVLKPPCTASLSHTMGVRKGSRWLRSCSGPAIGASANPSSSPSKRKTGPGRLSNSRATARAFSGSGAGDQAAEVVVGEHPALAAGAQAGLDRVRSLAASSTANSSSKLKTTSSVSR